MSSSFGTPLAVDLHDRHLQAFGKDVGRGAVERAADVGPMRHAAGESHHLAIVKDRHGEGHVVEVAAGDIGIVGQEDVAGVEVLDAVMGELGFHRIAHAADEHRQSEPDRNGIALCIEQADGEIERLVDDHVVGGAHQIGLHLFGCGDETIAHDFRRHRIRPVAGRRDLGFQRGIHAQLRKTSITRSPKASTATTSPGCTTVVDAYSSINAGPVMRFSASSAARS
jgi:hypothetical protein